MLSWFAMYTVIHITSSLVIAAICKVTIFPATEAAVLFLFFLFFQLSIVSWAYFVTAFFAKSMTGAMSGTIGFFFGFFVTVAIRPEYSISIRTAACILPAAAYSLGVSQIALFEGDATPVTWSNLSEVENGFSVAIALWMLLLDSILYMFLGWYFDQVWPQEYGIRQPPHFFLLPSYWLGKTSEASTAHSVTDRHDGQKENLLEMGDPLAADDGASAADGGGGCFEAVPAVLREQEGQGRCCVLRQLRKEYGTPDGTKVAVHGLDLCMYEGQIFALLGHNGAGKTTTISMLCGLTEPSSGDATILGMSIRGDMATIRRSLGVCPQHDVLYPNLSVREHLAVYAQLKGLEGAELDEEVDAKIRMVGLTEKVHVQSSKLSGGMKRKLSVAISLLGDARMVFMDEPTSGIIIRLNISVLFSLILSCEIRNGPLLEEEHVGYHSG
jgi:ABC-type Na+ transport system ATPase subunit NatA